MTKKTVSAKISTLYVSRPVTEVIRVLQAMVDEHGPSLRLTQERGLEDDDDEVYIYGDRLETDAEELQRLLKLDEDMARREAYDKAVYRRLKEKYGE